jgi:hypothetical protein
MSWMRAGEQLGQGLALGWSHVRDGFVEVCLIFGAYVLGLEDLRTSSGTRYGMPPGVWWMISL